MRRVTVTMSTNQDGVPWWVTGRYWLPPRPSSTVWVTAHNNFLITSLYNETSQMVGQYTHILFHTARTAEHTSEASLPGWAGRTDDRRRIERFVSQAGRQSVIGGAAQSGLPPTLKRNMKTTFTSTGFSRVTSVVRKITESVKYLLIDFCPSMHHHRGILWFLAHRLID